jgi:Transposase Tn5 dimerisation domain
VFEDRLPDRSPPSPHRRASHPPAGMAPLAVRLVQLRDRARQSPDTPAREVVEADLLALVAAQAHQSPSHMTTVDFWREVARLGGYLARRRDGPPGWKTLWQGWLHVQTLLDGVHLAAQLRW